MCKKKGDQVYIFIFLRKWVVGGAQAGYTHTHTVLVPHSVRARHVAAVGWRSQVGLPTWNSPKERESGTWRDSHLHDKTFASIQEETNLRQMQGEDSSQSRESNAGPTSWICFPCHNWRKPTPWFLKKGFWDLGLVWPGRNSLTQLSPDAREWSFHSFLSFFSFEKHRKSCIMSTASWHSSLAERWISKCAWCIFFYPGVKQASPGTYRPSSSNRWAPTHLSLSLLLTHAFRHCP